MKYKILPVGPLTKENLPGEARQRIEVVWNETTQHMGTESFNVIH